MVKKSIKKIIQKNPKSPSRMGPPRVSSVRNLLEKVGDLRGIAILVQSNLAFLTFTDLYLQSQTVSDYHPLFCFWVFCFLKSTIFGFLWSRSRNLKELPNTMYYYWLCLFCFQFSKSWRIQCNFLLLLIWHFIFFLNCWKLICFVLFLL